MRVYKGMEVLEMCMVLKLVQKQLYAIWIVHGEKHCNHLPIIKITSNLPLYYINIKLILYVLV